MCARSLGTGDDFPLVHLAFDEVRASALAFTMHKGDCGRFPALSGSRRCPRQIMYSKYRYGRLCANNQTCVGTMPMVTYQIDFQQS